MLHCVSCAFIHEPVGKQITKTLSWSIVEL